MPGTFKYRSGNRPQSEDIQAQIEQRITPNKKRSKSDSRNKRVSKVRAGNMRVSMNAGHQHTAVRPHDQSVLAMDSVLWTDRHYTIPQLVMEFGSKLPSLVKVTRGYHDDSIDISVNEVLLVQNYARQKRINVITANEKEMSIPADSPLNVMIPSQEFPVKIGECCDNCPVEVQICEPRNLLAESDTLKLRSISHETFVRTSKIIDGWIDQFDVFEIPSLFSVEFAVAEGISGATQADWIDYKLMYEYSVRHLNFDTKGYQDIFIYNETRRISLLKPKSLFDRPDSRLSSRSDDVVYSLDVSHRPSSVSPGLGTTAETAHQGELTPPPPLRRVHHVSPTHRPFSETTPRPLPTNASSPLHIDTRSTTIDVEYMNTATQEEGVPTAPPDTAGPLTPCSDVTSNGDLDDMFNDVIEVAEIDASTQEIIFNSSFEADSIGRFNKKTGRVQEEISLLENINAREIEIARQSPLNLNGVENVAFSASPVAAVKSQILLPDRQLTNDAINRELFVSLRAMNKYTINNCTRPMTSECRFNSLTQVPSDISELTTGEVQRCLELMMVKDRRRLAEVDGAVLCKLSDRQLAMEPYCLTPFDCSKVTRFVRGWRP